VDSSGSGKDEKFTDVTSIESARRIWLLVPASRSKLSIGRAFAQFYTFIALSKESKMSIIEKSIEVNVPAPTAYNQWTQFEEFPRFMDGVLEVRQLDDKMTRWWTNIGGIEKEFDAEITEQIPDKRIAWRSRSGASNAGVVTFHSLNDQSTRIMV